MIKKQSLIVLVFLCASFLGFGQISDLIISEYSEGSSQNKYIEIYNGTGVSIDLFDYSVELYANGSATLTNDHTFANGTILLDGDVHVLYNASASPTIIAAGDVATTPPNFNGNDALTLSKLGVVIDVVGTVGTNPGTGWQVAGVSNATAEHTLVRKSTICNPNTNWTSSAGTNPTDSEWIVYNQDDWSYLGSHSEICSSTTPIIIVNTTSLTNFTYAEDGGPSTEQSFTIECINLTDDIDVTPPVDWEISLTTGDAFVATNPITLMQTGGNIPTTTIYARLKTGLLNTNSPFLGNITATSTLDAITENIAVNGTVLPPIADVVITEIMYNTTGTDDEWIEICNVSGSTQDVSNYIIKIGVSPTETTLYTFPASTTISDGTCIIVSLGSNGDGTYNNDCEITPVIYGIGANTNDTDNLVNSSNTITLYASDGTTDADVVTYDDGDDSSTDGNGSSYHIIDISADNSVTSSNWQAVDLGGSPRVNSLVPNCIPMVAEIRVDGNLFPFPNIPDDDTGINIPTGTNNTLFAAQFVGSTQSKSYRIQNFGGLDLNLTSITIIGANPGEFNISGIPGSPVIYGTPSILEVTFAPTTAGIKTAIVRIANNDDNTDGDTEEIYTFNIQGEGKCVGSIDAISPLSGPIGTIVAVSATGLDLSTASASFNSVPVTTLNYIVATDELEVTVPDTATDGNLELLDGNGCTGFFAFDVIDNKIGGCEGGASLTNLFISEVTDATTGGMTYIEIYNGTGGSVSLNGYSLEIISNGNSSGNTLALNNVSLADDDTYVVAIGVASSPITSGSGANTCPINIMGNPVGNGELADQTSTIGGINKKDNEHDMIRLVDSGGTVDEFGVYQDDDWMDSTIITGNRGFNFRRLATASPLPNPTFSLSDIPDDWNVIDWVGSGLSSCNTNDYSDIGIYDFSTGTPPSVDTGPILNTSCNTATIEVTGSEGFVGNNPLTYQWFVSAPGDSGWTALINDATYNDVATATLDVLDTSLLEGYQYYCQIREDDQDCYTASDAVQLTLPTTTWTSGGWVPGAPDADTIAIIDYDYNTFTNGNIDACNLVVNDDGMGGLYTLTIANNSYVKVENNLIVNGKIIVNPKGSFVQVNDNGTVTVATQTSITVEKETAPMDAWYEYTYWSSPVSGETINLGLYESASDRRFWFNAQNYKDDLKENGNSGSYSSGQDDIDDNGDDWILVTNGNDTMIAGVGYASTHNKGIFNSSPCYTDNNVNTPCQFTYTFEGPFNNGVINVPVYRNDDEMADNNWNLIGNPYSSAIYVNDFLTVNAGVFSAVPLSPPVGGLNNGAIFIWSQASPPDEDNPGNQNQNFKQSDYAIINTTGQTAGGDGIIPSRYIPSGQSFFMAYDNSAVGNLISSSPDDIYEGNVVFNNSMRVTTNNDQFFRGTNSKSSSLDNKIWINLTSDNGVFNQLAIAYVDNATNGYDGMGYDTPRNLSTELYSSIYTIIEGEDKKFAIQGKAKGSLTLDESIPLGFDTSINVATLYTLSISQMEGEFLNNNTIYLKDYLMNIVHDLSNSEYTFTSEVGEFKERFEIVFTNASLSTNENSLADNTISIVELDSDNVRFKTSSNQTIKTVVIYDVLGRLLYNLNGNSSSETYNLSSLSQATYIAKVELSNGLIITKKAIKRK